MNALTEKQAAVLEFIKEHQEKYKCSPTRKEIADHFKYRSANAAEEHIQALVRKGQLRLDPEKKRRIEVLG